MTPERAASILNEAAQSLGRGDGAAARDLLAPLMESAAVPPPALFLMAQACRLEGDRAAEEAAIDRLLQAQPNHLGARMIKGDARRGAGDDAAALDHYRQALAVAGDVQRRGETLPPTLSSELARISRWVEESSAHQMMRIEQALGSNGFPKGQRSELIDETLALLRGEVPVQLQQPKNLYVPGFPQRAFYGRGDFDWIPALENSTDVIADEAAALLDSESGGYAPYIPAGADRSGGQAPNAHLVGSDNWGAFHLLRGGEAVVGNVERCPQTMTALDAVPMPRIAGRSAMALFSLLRPGAHIRPHHGLFNFRLICHLPLIVPPGCTFRVGNHQRDWVRGETLIFDDSMEHEAWNRSDQVRVILLFEIWRPELSEADRAALTVLLEASHIPAED